jgi:hypothetical protein
MSTYTWEFGSEGSGLHFTIVYDDVSGQFSVNSLEGSFDLNALWFSNGDSTVDGSTTLVKSDSSLNMNGSNTVWDDEGNATSEKITWDSYLKLSSTGLGSEGEDKCTFISEGESKTFDAPYGFDPEGITLGVRATSVNGGDGIKWVDKDPTYTPDEPVNQAPTATEINVSATETESSYDSDHQITNQNLPDDSDTKTVDLLDPAHVNDPDGDTLTVSNIQFFDADDNPISQPGYITVVGNSLVIEQNSQLLNELLNGTHLDIYATYDIDDGNGHTISNTVNIDITGTADLYQLSSNADASTTYTGPFSTTTWDGSFNLDLNAPEGAFDFSGTATVSVTGDIDNDTGSVGTGQTGDEYVTVTLEGGDSAVLGLVDGTGTQNQEDPYLSGPPPQVSQERTDIDQIDFVSADDSISVNYDSNTAGGADGVDDLTSISVSVTAEYDYWIYQ